MADFFRGLRGGFDVGLEAGTERRKRKMEQELAAQGDEYDTVQGRGLRVTDRSTGEESSVVIDPTAGADMDAIRKQYMDAGYMVDTMDNAYTARSGQGADTGVHTDAAAAQSAARKGNYGLTNKRAGIYEKYGDVEMARGLRRDAQAMKAQDQEIDIRLAGEKRAQETHGLQMQEQQRNERAAQRLEFFKADAAQLEAQGALKTVDDWRRLGAEHGLSPDQMFSFANAKMGLDELQTKQETTERIKLYDAAARQGLGAVIQMYDSHPLFDNGKKMSVRQGRNGIELYDGKVLVAQAANERDALALLRTHLEDPVKATALAYDIEKTRAAIRASDASAEKDRAAGAYYRAGGKNAENGGGSAYKEPTPQMLEWAQGVGAELGWDAKKYNRAVSLANMRAAELGVPFSVAFAELTGRDLSPAPAKQPDRPPAAGVKPRQAAQPAWDMYSDPRKPKNVFQSLGDSLRGYSLEEDEL